MLTYDWDEKCPGALEIDLVEHNGGSSLGHFAYTLTVVDIVTGYTRRRAMLGRSQLAVLREVKLVVSEWPMKPWGIHTDNGSEFLNGHLKTFCQSANLKFTRSRPYRKNDNAHVEQKNRFFVRELVGYERFDTPEQVEWLNSIYELHDLYANNFLPMRKLIHKERIGAHVRKKYDDAKAPILRLFDTDALSSPEVECLLHARSTLDPLALHKRLEELLASDPPTLSTTRDEAI